MADWWEKPFSIELDGKPWAVLTDKVALMAIQTESKLPPVTAPEEAVTSIRQMISLVPSSTRATSVESLRVFLVSKTYASVLGVPLDTQRLVRILGKIKKPEVDLWNASKNFSAPCLGLLVQSKWKAYLMGVGSLEEEVPAYPFESSERDLFNEVMS